MRKILLLLFSVFLFTSTAKAGGFALYEASIRANGMLGAFSAYADHVSTIYYNPAGLSELDGFRFSGGTTFIKPNSSFRGPLPYSDTEYEMKDQTFAVPNAFASYQLQEGLTAGVGVYAPFGLGTKWPSDWVGRSEAVHTEISTLFLNPAVGYTLPDLGIGKVRVGAGLQMPIHGDVTLARAVTSFEPEGDFRLEGSMDGPSYGYNLGILYAPIKYLTLGFTYRSEVSMDFKGDAQFQNLPESGFPPGTKGSTTLDLPSSWVAAVNVQPTENLTIEADYVHWGWSSYNDLTINFSQIIPAFEGKTLSKPRDYKDVWQLRGGFEYQNFLVDDLTVRGGIAYDKSPVPDRTYDPTLPGADRILYSMGATYQVTPKLSVDFSYIHIRFEQRKNTTSMTGLDGVYNSTAYLPGAGISFKL